MCEHYSPREDEMIRAYYSECGPKWKGWEILMPGRNDSSICARAQRLGVSVDDRNSLLVHDSLDGIEDRARTAVAALDDGTRARLKSMFGSRM